MFKTSTLCRIIALVLCAAAVLSLVSCNKKETPVEPPEDTNIPAPQPEPEPEPEKYVYEPYKFDDAELVPYDGVVEHLFFHPVIAYPELAFDGDSKEAGIDDWMVTVSEFNKILDSLYEKGYILVDINSVWSEYTDDSGETRMQRNTLRIPEGRKPLILSIDDPNYYQYMLENGFTY